MTIEQLIEHFDGKDPASFAADNLHLLDHNIKRQLATMMLERILEASDAST